jgi:hypothetical protein
MGQCGKYFSYMCCINVQRELLATDPAGGGEAKALIALGPEAPIKCLGPTLSVRLM